MSGPDIAIIGAGPAGLSAAIEARAAGLSAVVIDEQPAPGGQIWRGLEAASPRQLEILGPDYARGAAVVRAFRDSGADYLPGSLVWNIGADLTLDITGPGGGRQVRAGALVVATGAVERPMPVPGWTLPGVVTAGALQILLKTAGLAEQGAVLAGNGPLIWLIASQMVAAGVPPRAIVEAVPPGRYLSAARHLPWGLFAARDLRKGLSMVRKVRAAGVPVHRNATDLMVEGEDRATGLSFTAGGRRHRIEAGCVALHHGVVPNQQASRLLRVGHAWNAGQDCFAPVTDVYGETDRAGVFVAGDGGGIVGADAAGLSGRIAAARIARKAGRQPASVPEALAAEFRRRTALRPMLDALYAPVAQALAPADETILCRCEEVTAGQLRAAVGIGAAGPNQIKSFLRAGMGPCQGRVCGLSVSGLIAAERGMPHDEVGYYSIRPPLKPIRLAEIAGLEPATN